MLRIGECYRLPGLAAVLVSLTFAAAAVFGQGPVNFPPDGQMLQPANGSLIRSIGPMTLRARMRDRDGVVESVRFYVGTNLLGIGTPSGSNEFSMFWTTGRTGNLGLHASAISNRGSTGIPATVLISVATNPP